MSDRKVQKSNMTQYDEKGKVLREPKDNSTGRAVNFRWWTLEEKDMPGAILGTVEFIKRHQGSRLEQLVQNTRLYGNSNGYNLIGSALTRSSSANANPMSQRISFNMVESVVDTLQSKMAKLKVTPAFITNGGDWHAQYQAKQLTKFAQGLFYGSNVHKKSIHAWTDSAVWGDGFLKVFEKDDKVAIERVLPHDILVDMVESTLCPPQQLHQSKVMDRDIAFEMFPELEEQISTVSPAQYQDVGGQGTAVDVITVVESWHLKSSPSAKDGVRVITIGDGSLCSPWEHDYFPFPHLRYARRQLGWYGQGVAERLQNIQGELNRNMILKQRSHWMQGSFKVLIPIGSKIVSQHLNNDVGTQIFYSGEPPTYVVPPASNPDLQQWIDWLINSGYQQEGISKMSTTGEAPLGVESGKALRTLVQVSDDRFLFMQQELEDFNLEICKQAINVVKDIYKSKGKYEVIWPNTTFMETVDWGSIKLSEEQYVLKAYPTSSLSDDLTGRLEEVKELAQAGWVSPRAARRLMDMPDIEVNDALANAAEDRLQQIFENMLDQGEMIRFQPGFHDAVIAKQLGLQYINYAEFHDCPDDRIQLIRDFLAQINSEASGPAPGIVAPDASVQPQANPEAPPTSSLISNVPRGTQPMNGAMQ